MPSSSSLHISRTSSSIFSCSSVSSKCATAEDISRLLDPTYSSAQQTHSISVYIDGRGDLHDPDYRHFPTITTLTLARRHSGGAYYSANHPLWDEHAMDEEEVEEDDRVSCLYNHRSPTSPSRRSPSSRHSSSATPRSNFATSTCRSSNSPPSYHYSAYSYSSDISPTSYDSEDTGVLSSSFSSYTSPFEEKEKRSSRLFTKRKRSSSKEEMLASTTPITRLLLPTTEEDSPKAVSGDEAECVPTCMQSLKRQWQALSLAFQLGVFRAQRRMRQNVHSLT